MPLGEIKSKPENTVFMIRDMADAQIAICKISNPSFIKEASDIDRSLIGTMVSELCTNIVKYAGRGSVKMSKSKTKDTCDIEIWAEDDGPGILSIEMALRDHYTTGNSLGLGLPGLKRMADEFSIDSKKDQGTTVYVRKRIEGRKDAIKIIPIKKNSLTDKVSPNSALWDVGFFNRPMPGELVSGDSIFIVELESSILLATIDVSGHGVNAHKLSLDIQRYIADHSLKNIDFLMKDLHTFLIGTLGAAVGMLLINIECGTFQYVSVGNTNAMRCVGKKWRGLPRDGVLGVRLPNLYLQDGMIERGDLFIMWSDGLSDNLISKYVQGRAYESSQKIARNLVDSFGKQHDDASCIVFQWLA